MEAAAAMAMTSAAHAAPALAPSHDAANKEVAAYRKERDTILSKIIKGDERSKPPQTKIPKRKNPEASHSDYNKRARTEHRGGGSSSRGTPSGRTPSGHTPTRGTPTRGTPTQNTPKRGDDVGDRE